MREGLASESDATSHLLEELGLLVQVVELDAVASALVGKVVGDGVEVFLNALSVRTRGKVNQLLNKDFLLFLSPGGQG